MPPFRYQQFCPAARGAEILGERWTLLIVRELCCGPQRFSDLRRRLPGISTSVLSDRLSRLEVRGLVARDEQPPPTPAALYRLTAQGEHLRPLMRELIRFGVRHLLPPQPGDHLEAEWVGLGLEAFARRTPVPRRTVALRLRDGEREVLLLVRGGRRGTTITQGEGPADATLRAAPIVLLGLLSGGLDPDAAVGSGAVEVDGDVGALRDLPALFDLNELMTPSAGSGPSVP